MRAMIRQPGPFEFCAVRVFLLTLGGKSMDDGLVVYSTFVVVVAIVLHLLSRRFFVVSLAGALLCSVAALWYSTWVAHFCVNIGWAPIILVAGVVYALPVILAVGLPFLLVRRSRRMVHKSGKGIVADEL
jgi:MFS family permease